MKNRIIFGVLLAVFVTAVYVGAQASAQSVAIPNEINLFIAGLVFALLTAGFNWLFQYVGIDLRDFATPISGALSAWILAELQGLVDLIPAAYDTYVTLAFKLIIVIIGGMGALAFAAKARGSKDSLL